MGKKMGTGCAIEIRNLTYDCSGRDPLRDISLKVPLREEGWDTWLLGLNGSGKSAMMRSIAGLSSPQTGSVRVFDCNPATEPEVVYTAVGYVCADPQFPRDMKVGALVRYTERCSLSWHPEYVNELYKLVKQWMKRRIHALQRSESVLLQFFLGLASVPNLMLIDHDLSGLDCKNKACIFDALSGEEIAKWQTRVWALSAIEGFEKPIGCANQILILKSGRLVLDADPSGCKTINPQFLE